ncbi:MAG: DeoR/GlpR family DNA-binding transcription regulator [Eubacteriales bacterium]
MDYNAEQRREKILELLGEKGEVRVSSLSDLFGISEVTVRGDLEYLSLQGLLSRIHGGAVSSSKLYHEMDLKERLSANETEKKVIAERVASMIHDNESIMLNSGTTITYVLRALRGRHNLTLVTNSLPIATEASAYKSFNVILLGGLINSKYLFTYGDDALRQLSCYHADKLVLSVDGIDRDCGLTLYYANETEISRRMIAQSASVIVAADYSKIGRVAFADIAPVTRADCIVTNASASAEYITSLRDAGVTVVTV